jgi:hypothetical protein
MPARLATTLSAIAVCAVLAACGGDDDGGNGGGDLPEPPDGKATIGGKLVQDGKPLAREDVSLSVGGQTRTKTKTDAQGRYVFRGVAPARYAVGVALTFTPEQTAGGGKCDVPGYQGLTLGGTTRSGGQVTLASLQSDPFAVESGDRVVKDITVTCKRE